MKAPKIKTLIKQPKIPKPKRFTINAFLDKYINELKPPKTSYDKYLEGKKKN